MTDLFQEIMQDVQADRASDLWNKYGKWVIYTAVSIVIVTAAATYWKHHEREDAMRETAFYLSASDALAKGDPAAAMLSLDKISVPERSSYYGLVLLKKVEAQEALGKDDEAKKLLSELAKRADVYGDIGKAMLGDASVATEPKTSPLMYTRSEWAAWDMVAKGQDAKAADQFAALAKMDDAPASLRDRAMTMATYLKNKPGAQ